MCQYIEADDLEAGTKQTDPVRFHEGVDSAVLLSGAMLIPGELWSARHRGQDCSRSSGRASRRNPP